MRKALLKAIRETSRQGKGKGGYVISPAMTKLFKLILCLSAAGTLAGVMAAYRKSPEPSLGLQPNIIFILADDMGYGDIQYLNKNAQVQTPNLNKLAEGGIAFTDAHSGSAVCTPTRYGVLTGRYAFRSPLKKGVLGGYSPALIEPERVTLPGILKQAGYHTAVIGKWHLGLDWPAKDDSKPAVESLPDYGANTDNIDWGAKIKNGPNELGFDESYIVSASLDMPPYAFIENGKVAHPSFSTPLTASTQPRGNIWRAGMIAAGFKLEETLDILIGKSQEYIAHAGKTGKPFFLYLPLTSPHTPWLPGKDYEGKSGAGTYGDFVMHTDAAVGKLMRTLDSLKLTENTLVIFTSDNGADWKPQDKKKYPKHQANYIYRGGKSDVWEGGHRVPFLAHWPAQIKSGQWATQTICLTDMLATAAALTSQKLAPEAGPDSYSFLPVLQQANYSRPIRNSIIHHSIDGTFAIRKGKWKFIDSNGSGGWAMQVEKPGSEPGQLYDMLADPWETTNVYTKYPQVVRQLKALLEEQKQQGYTRNIVSSGPDR